MNYNRSPHIILLSSLMLLIILGIAIWYVYGTAQPSAEIETNEISVTTNETEAVSVAETAQLRRTLPQNGYLADDGSLVNLYDSEEIEDRVISTTTSESAVETEYTPSEALESDVTSTEELEINSQLPPREIPENTNESTQTTAQEIITVSGEDESVSFGEVTQNNRTHTGDPQAVVQRGVVHFYDEASKSLVISEPGEQLSEISTDAETVVEIDGQITTFDAIRPLDILLVSGVQYPESTKTYAETIQIVGVYSYPDVNRP